MKGVNNMENLNLKYAVIDTEVLEDYFSLQVKNETMNTVAVYECYNDDDIKQVYKMLKSATRPMYAYSIDYDKVILNALCKFVENRTTNIVYHLRKISDYVIQHKINYFRLNADFWTESFFKIQKNDKYVDYKTLFQLSINRTKSMYSEKSIHDFLDEYGYILGKSKVFKNLIINSIPKIYFYYTIKVDKSIQMTISLKKLQLIHEGYNVKFDFSKYTKMADIKAAGLYEYFIQYSENDVLFLEKLFLDKPKDDIIKRYYAYKAVKQINPDIEIGINELYAENDTALITKILQIDRPNKNIEVDYTKLIKTNYPEFNRFVKFVSSNNDVKRDRELKDGYCNLFQKEYINDDYQILDNNKVDVVVNSFDTITINGTVVKFGLGGAHGAIDKYIGENLKHLDYTSQYPSIILQYKHLFRNIINVELYEAVYNMRVDAKPKLKEIEKQFGRDSVEYKELDLLVSGLKLILNTAYGLINSNFELPISCKVLGRFICLKGQSLLLNLSYKLIELNNMILLVNVNTDGIIVKLPENCNIDQLIKDDIDGYFILGVDHINKIIQKDVNSYLKIMGNNLRKKGAFNIKVKQNINRHERLSVNTINAIRCINHQSVKILPVYFDTKWVDMEEKSYYLTTPDKGKIAIKQTKKPEILSINGEQMYFTDNQDDADLGIYQKYARIVESKILDFTFVNSDIKNIPYIEEPINPDSDENNKLKRKIKRQLYKLFVDDKDKIGFVGYKGNNKANSYHDGNPVKPLIHYNMTQIQNSTYCKGFSLTPNGTFVIFDIDLFDKNTGNLKPGWKKCKSLIEVLQSQNTFECWNNKTEKINRKFIFKCSEDINLINDYDGYIEILKDKATIYSLPDNSDIIYSCNFEEPKTLNLDILRGHLKKTC